MIKIGINENVFIQSVSKTEDGVLVIAFSQPGGEAAADTSAIKAALAENPFADWEDGSESFHEGLNGLSIRIFPFDADPTMSNPEVLPDSNEMRNRLNALRDPLTHLLLGYMTKDKNPLKPQAAFRGTGIDVNINLFPQLITSEEIIGKIYSNIVDTFIEAITPFVNNESLLFRAKFPRQSKKKAFATLPSKFIGPENPFWESMAIPAEASKIKWTPYEIRQGLDKDTPYASQNEADTTDADSTAEPQNDPFASR